MGALAGIKIKYAVIAVVAIGIIAWVMARPAVAAYLLIFLTPLIVGLNDAVVVHALRPNETLMGLLGLAIGLRWLIRVRTGEVRWPRIDGVDVEPHRARHHEFGAAAGDDGLPAAHHHRR